MHRSPHRTQVHELTALDAVLRDATSTSIVVFDADLRIVGVTGGALDGIGLDSSTIVGRRAAEVFPAKSWKRAEASYRAALDGHDGSTMFQSIDGSRWFRVVTHPIPGPTPMGVAISTTITAPEGEAFEPVGRLEDRRSPNRRSRDTDAPGGDSTPSAEELFELAFRQAATGMALLDLGGRFLRVNETLCALLGRRPAELEATTLRRLTHPDDAGMPHARDLMEGRVDRLSTEIRCRHSGGHWVTLMLSIALARNGVGDAEMYVAQIVDLTARKASEAQLEKVATEDPLTGLANRRRIQTALDEIAAAGHPAAALLVDIDGFKYANVAFGHGVGDRILVSVAQRLKDCARGGDIVGRIGGDEFVVVMPSATAAEAIEVAQELCGWIERISFTVDAQTQLTPTASIGVAVVDETLSDGAAVMLAADIAMYDAKEQGGNRAVMYGGEVAAHARANNDLQWLAELRRALTDHRFELHAQAIVDLETGHPVKHEVLLRLRGEDGTLIYPGAFMPAAERLRLMRDLDEWVVTEAASYAADYPAATLGVNLSGSSVCDPGLAHRIEQIIEHAGCEPAQLVFEITETEAIANLEQAKSLVLHLHGLGCRFALDDFGAGYASFSHLKRLPVEFVKIDGQFIRELADNEDDQLIVQAIQTVAQGMHRKVVAEQIEDQVSADLLHKMGVPFGQGYHFARPAPIDDVLEAARVAALPRLL